MISCLNPSCHFKRVISVLVFSVKRLSTSVFVCGFCLFWSWRFAKKFHRTGFASRRKKRIKPKSWQEEKHGVGMLLWGNWANSQTHCYSHVSRTNRSKRQESAIVNESVSCELHGVPLSFLSFFTCIVGLTNVELKGLRARILSLRWQDLFFCHYSILL